ncbi:MAG: AAA family ATPase [Chloroflexi bacterium]|nr:AAA family ATPase [Chloroflexota bacterium]
MKLKQVTIENYRAIEHLELPLHPQLTVLHGDNGHGKTSVLSGIAVGLGSIPTLLPEVSGIGFRKTDRRGLQTRVELETTDGVRWERQVGWRVRRPLGIQALRVQMRELIDADVEGEEPFDMPIVASYDTDRAVLDVPQRRRGFNREFSRYQALDGALSARTNFREFFIWFYAKENEELRHQRELRDFDHRSKELSAVRSAIESTIGGVSSPRIETRPLRFVVSVGLEDKKSETLEIAQLSGGYRISLALVADLARRMAQGNPHLEDPLQSEAIILIDEVDLHLHPSWQQRILTDLMRTFPNAQFIVSTHSPQVLTTVKPEHIVELYREGAGIVAGGASGPTYGAEAGYVLSAVMGVKERPSSEHNDLVALLERYNDLVYGGQGRSGDALQLRQELERLSPHDLALSSADSEMRRQEVMEKLGRA